MKLVRLVPCCTITTQQDQIIRVLLGQFLKKYVHTSRIAIRHNKKTGASRYWFNSSVRIPIFTNVMARYRWTNALVTPAVFGTGIPVFFAVSHASLRIRLLSTPPEKATQTGAFAFSAMNCFKDSLFSVSDIIGLFSMVLDSPLNYLTRMHCAVFQSQKCLL